MNLYEARHPQEAYLAKKHVKEVKGTRANVFAADFNMDMRLAVRLPKRLYDVLSKLDSPPFLHEQDELTWFIRKFPSYCVTQKT